MNLYDIEGVVYNLEMTKTKRTLCGQCTLTCRRCFRLLFAVDAPGVALLGLSVFL